MGCQTSLDNCNHSDSPGSQDSPDNQDTQTKNENDDNQ